MWTNKNRARYDRSKLRYPSDLTEGEWQLVEPLIPPGKPGGDKRTANMREVVNGLMYVLSTGCQWRAIPKDVPPKSTVYDYFDLWTYDGTLFASIIRFMSNAANKNSEKPVRPPSLSTARPSGYGSVGKIAAPLREMTIAVPGNFAHPTQEVIHLAPNPAQRYQ